MDLHDLEHNTRDGLHMASLAGAWIALVSGFGGMRDHDNGRLVFAPRLPEGLTKLSFTIRQRGLRLRVTTDGETATYNLFDHGSSLVVLHHGQELEVRSGAPVTAEIPPPPQAPKVTQPYGREPRLFHREVHE
jgi:alpha,alpha-trehalose phosphorylase